VTPLVEQLKTAAADDHIDTVHIVGNERLTVTVDDEQMPASDLGPYLRSEDVAVDEIDVYEDFTDTLPEA